MRILFLALDVDVCGRAGDSTHVRELASAFSELGNQVALVGYTPVENQGSVLRLARNIGVSIFIPAERSDLSILRFCRRLVKEFKPDVIYERRFSPKIGGALGKITRVPSMVEINGIIEEERELLVGEDGSKSVLEKIKRRVRTYFLRSSDGVVAVSEGIARILRDEYRVPSSRLHVVHNGANTKLFRPLDRGTCIKKLDMSPSRRYICFCGNLAPWQGVEYLISAIPDLKEEFGDLCVLIVGDGVKREHLEEQARKLEVDDMVQFCGFQPYEQVPLYIGASEACVAPFSGIERNVRYGISPIKLYEYMACARPFVTTSAWDTDAGIHQENVGIVVEPDNGVEIANALADLLRDKKRAAAMGERGRAFAEKDYSWKAVASRIVEIFHNASEG